MSLSVLRNLELLKPRSLLFRLDVTPFVVLYAIALYISMETDLLDVPGLPGLVFIIVLFSNGLVFLSQKWFISFKRRVTYEPAKNFLDATMVYVPGNEKYLKPVIAPLIRSTEEDRQLLAECQKFSGDLPQEISKLFSVSDYSIRYQSLSYSLSMSNSEDSSELIATCVPLPDAMSISNYVNWNGWSSNGRIAHITLLRRLFGQNHVEVPVPEFFELFKDHATAPFFIFQVFCVALWCLDEYIMYSLFTLGTLVLLEAMMVFQRIKTAQVLRGMRPPSSMVYVFRGHWQLVSSDELVPLDLVSISSNDSLVAAGGNLSRLSVQQVETEENRVCPADVVLLNCSVVVNEAMLTGESTPQLKDSIIDVLQAENSDDSSLTQKENSFSSSLLSQPLNAFASDDGTSSRSHTSAVLYAGTKVIQVTQPVVDEGGEVSKGQESSHLRPKQTPDHGALGVVVRSGVYTGQGSLMRTIIHASDPGSIHDIEALYFILILLVFAIAASSYVLHFSLQDPNRDRWKLLLHCIMIITSVVPPELPVELALAVNASISALGKKGIFCTEPFRIPLSGKINVCCFDKTGTLTSDTFVVQAIAQLSQSDQSGTFQLVDAPSSCAAAKLVLTGCHALIAVQKPSVKVVQVPIPNPFQAAAGPNQNPVRAPAQRTRAEKRVVVSVEIVGDSIEQAAVAAVGWTVTKDGNAVQSSSIADSSVASSSLKELPVIDESRPYVTVLRRWAFSSTLKRMTTIVNAGNKPHVNSASKEKDTLYSSENSKKDTFVLCKGAPEALEPLLARVPLGYADVHSKLASSGARVLALAYRRLPTPLSGPAEAQRMRRVDAEKDLVFAGFISVTSPVKTDSERTVNELQNAGRRVVMITGDSPLTALSVARKLKIGLAAHVDPAELTVSKAKSDNRRENGRCFILSLVPSDLSRENPYNEDEAASVEVMLQDTSALMDSSGSAVGEHLTGAIVSSGNASGSIHKQLVKFMDIFTPHNLHLTEDSLNGQHTPLSPVTSSFILNTNDIICVTGASLETLERVLPQSLQQRLAALVSVYARVSPAQKERIIASINALPGRFTAMVGDGSNDTGALKKAHVGLAIISNPELERKYDQLRLQQVQKALQQREARERMIKEQQEKLRARGIPIADVQSKTGLQQMVDEDEVLGEELEALLSSSRTPLPDAADPMMQMLGVNSDTLENSLLRMNPGANGSTDGAGDNLHSRMQRKLKEMEQESQSMDGSNVVALGDASMAASLTSKMPSPYSLVEIMKQGRCTLVITHQMFKILAVNSLLLSFQLSFLFINNVKSGDAQATITGMSAAAFFMFLSWAKPTNRLSRDQPKYSVFTKPLLLSVALQFVTHLLSLLFISYLVGFDLSEPNPFTKDPVVDTNVTLGLGDLSQAEFEQQQNLNQDLLEAKLSGADTAAADAASEGGLLSMLFGFSAYDAQYDPEDMGSSSKFKPNVINSAIFLLSLAAQTCTFLVSYTGEPFMSPLKDNKVLWRGGLLMYAIAVFGALNLSEDINYWFQLVPLDSFHDRLLLTAVIVLDGAICYFGERIIRRVTHYGK